MKLENVILPIIREIAVEMGDEGYFDKDCKLYAVALLLEVRNRRRTGMMGTTDLELAASDRNVKEANKLLKRKKITLLLPQ